ncbi:hypothetical protein K2173_002502 [Erythroxylum novogranatense]|uniref:P-type Ca(2+) transporter n=1 Tax=Erythroxylum novogranatense TaxID=1862640 RepID=A0AAV8TSY1_9ROSI|nr:hypothetical protein K2173_002502 [Erythroxylum novogranatense]
MSFIYVAKASADVIILDDDFSTIVKGVKWGRLIVMNIKKFIQFQLTVNVVALILNISSAWLTGSVPFSDVELLWVSLITDTLGAFALAAEAPDDNLMANPPDGRKGGVISSVMYRNIFGQFLYQFTIIWFLQAKGKEILGIDDPDSNLILDTFIFNTFIFCQVSNLISCRKLNEKNAFRGILCNYVFIAVLGLIVLFQITIIEFLDTLANTSPLTLWQWLLSIFIGLVGILVAAVFLSVSKAIELETSLCVLDVTSSSPCNGLIRFRIPGYSEFKMENLLSEFDVKAKHSSEETLKKWRKVCGLVKNPKRRFGFTANLSKREEAHAMRNTNQLHVLLAFFKRSICVISNVNGWFWAIEQHKTWD